MGTSQTRETSKVGAALKRWAYPAALILAPVGSGVLLSMGVAPLVVLGVAAAFAVGAVALLERVIPYREAWARGHDDVGTDVLHNLTNLAVPSLYRLGIESAGLLAAASALGAGGLWPGRWPLVLQVLLAFVVADLGAWLGHRLVHRVPALWRFHEVHHSAPRLYWLNTHRFHPVDLTIIHAASISPLLLLGAGEEVLVVLASATLTNALFQHCNAQIEAGWLNWVLSTAELHRWHHVAGEDHRHWNYGSGLIVWDLIAGTRHLPADEAPAQALAIPSYPKRFLQQLARPFWPGDSEAPR